jgi:hypothetical protein
MSFKIVQLIYAFLPILFVCFCSNVFSSFAFTSRLFCIEKGRKEGFYPSADSVHDAASAYFRDDLDGFHMSASRSCCAHPAWFEDVRLVKAGAAAAPAVAVR